MFWREQVLDRGVYTEIRTADVHVGRLRKALNRRDEQDSIRKVRFSGYTLDKAYEGR